MAKEKGTYKGAAYDGKWTSIDPDHLALLPESVGACSIEMGCGTHRAAESYFVTSEGAFRAAKTWSQEDRDALPSEDFAGPDQSYPIKDASDVADAWDLAGHAADPDAVRAKIKAIAKRKGFEASLPKTANVGAKAAMAKKTSVKERLAALLKGFRAAAESDDTEEESEAIGYKALSVLLDQAATSLGVCREAVDALEGSDLADDVEDAHLEAIISMAMQVYGSMNGIIGTATHCLSSYQDATPMAVYEARHAAGARHNAKDQKLIQDTHDMAVKLGASCDSMQAAALKAACRCTGEVMTKESRAAAIAALTKNPATGYTADDQKALDAMPDKTIMQLSKLAVDTAITTAEAFIRTAAAKTPADQLIQNKANADAALAAHAHGLNQSDAADAQKKLDKMSKDIESKKAEAKDDEPKDAERRAAEERRLATMTPEQREEEYLKSAPESIRTLVREDKARKSARREELITSLEAAQKAYTKDELTAMTLEQLEKTQTLVASVDPTFTPNFSGQALPVALAAGQQDRNVPPNAYDKQLEARRAAGKGKNVN
jgi:hypothetical protein